MFDGLPQRYSTVANTKNAGGGMGDVAIFHDTHLDRDVIVKALKPGTNPIRLLDEIRALAEIRSKHVVQIYDVVKDKSGNITALVEELLSGKHLYEITSPTNEAEFLSMMYQVAAGIAEIHRHGRVHRDIKPNNIRFDSEQCLKIYDFGLSRVDGVDNATTAMIGTPGYMAPELFQSDSSGKITFTTAIDVFAFGSTALAMCTGTLPPSLTFLPPKLPSDDASFSYIGFALALDVKNIMDRCFAVDPAERPTMEEIRSVLGRHLLQDKHRALLSYQGRNYTLDAGRKTVNLSVTGKGSLTLTYDGFDFRVSNISGHVSLNNARPSENQIVSGSCVIVLGDPLYRADRVSIAVDISHPELSA